MLLNRFFQDTTFFNLIFLICDKFSIFFLFTSLIVKFVLLNQRILVLQSNLGFIHRYSVFFVISEYFLESSFQFLAPIRIPF